MPSPDPDTLIPAVRVGPEWRDIDDGWDQPPQGHDWLYAGAICALPVGIAVGLLVWALS